MKIHRRGSESDKYGLRGGLAELAEGRTNTDGAVRQTRVRRLDPSDSSPTRLLDESDSPLAPRFRDLASFLH